MLKLTLPRFPTAATFSLNAPNISYQPSWEPGIETRQWKHHILKESLVASRVGHISASCWGAHRQLHPIQVPFRQNTPQPSGCVNPRFFRTWTSWSWFLITKWNAKWLRSAESSDTAGSWPSTGTMAVSCISASWSCCEDIGDVIRCDSFNWKFPWFGTSWYQPKCYCNEYASINSLYPSLATRKKAQELPTDETNLATCLLSDSESPLRHHHPRLHPAIRS